MTEQAIPAAQVRERLVRTKQKLDSIDRRRLNAGKRADYDSARRFLSQANAAVEANNLLLAESSVDKAETLADGPQQGVGAAETGRGADRDRRAIRNLRRRICQRDPFPCCHARRAPIRRQRRRLTCYPARDRRYGLRP